MAPTSAFGFRAGIIIVSAVLVAPSVGAPLTIRNGVDGVGSLEIATDDFGSFGAGLGLPDFYHWSGPGAQPGTFIFASFVQVFIDPSSTGQGTHRGILTGASQLLSTFGNGNLHAYVFLANSLLDPTTAESTFVVWGPGVAFRVKLTQRVFAGPLIGGVPRRSWLEQTYEFRNIGTHPTELIAAKHSDHDLPFNGGPAGDEVVGVDYTELSRPQVFAQLLALPALDLILRTREDMTLDPRTIDFVYYIGLQGLHPPGNPSYPGGQCPAYGYGVDLQVWNNYGAPNCWKNYVPGVGYNTSGITPALSGDSFLGLQVEASIVPGDTYKVTFTTIYGDRPVVTTQVPPAFEARTVAYHPDTGCGEFLWSLTNLNPIVFGQDPVVIDEFYIDVETGTGGHQPCLQMVPPPGWIVQTCAADAADGHRLYKFAGGAPIVRLDRVHGRFIVDTNGPTHTTDADTGIVVPPWSVVLHAAQRQQDAACDFTFGPRRSGEWSGQVIATAYLPVPSLTFAGSALLTIAVSFIGFREIKRRAPVRCAVN